MLQPGHKDARMKVLQVILIWFILFAICWPIALIALVLIPLFWIIALPFRLVMIVLEAVVSLFRGILYLPGRLLAGR